MIDRFDSDVPAQNGLLGAADGAFLPKSERRTDCLRPGHIRGVTSRINGSI